MRIAGEDDFEVQLSKFCEPLSQVPVFLAMALTE
jgi:hypothetical protein